MDFHSLSRRELQALCKRNKIPANITNIAMADALKALPTVEGLDDLLITSSDSPVKSEIKQSVSRTSYRTRRKPISEEPQTTQISTRTRGGARRAPAGENSAAPVDMVRRKMESQLMEAADDEKKGVETPAAVAVSRRRVGTSVKQAMCSTRRSTRMLEKQMMAMNLDNDDEEKVGDVQMVKEELAKVENETEVEGISQPKKLRELNVETQVSDEKPAVLIEEDSLMCKDIVAGSLNVGLQVISEPFDDSEDQKNAEVEYKEIDESLTKTKVDCEKYEETLEKTEIAETEGYLDTELTKTESVINSPSDGLVFENEEGFSDSKELEAASFDQSEIDQEAYKAEDSIVTKIESVINSPSDGLVFENEEGFSDIKELEAASFDQSEIDQEAYKAEDAIVTSIGEEKSKEDNFTSFQLEKESFAFDESITDQESITVLLKKDEPEEMLTMTDIEENPVQSVAVSEMEEETCAEKCCPISSISVMSGSQVLDHFEEKDCTDDDKSETEKTSNLPDINKENFVKEKVDKVKIADASLRQLKKMLKQLQITDKNTNIKEDVDVAKVGRSRPALQPLSDNSKTTSGRGN